MSEPDHSVRFVVSCADAADCAVAFEPLGTVISIGKGESLTVEISGPGTGIFEIAYSEGGVDVWAWSGGDTSAWDKAGNRLSI